MAGVRNRAAALALAAAGRANPVRGAPAARGRGRAGARQQRRLGEQRAAAGSRHARRAARTPAADRGGPGERGPAHPVHGRVPALRHEGADRAPARGRGHDDAAVRTVAARRLRHLRVHDRARAEPVRRLGAGPGPRQRRAGVGPVQAGPGRRLRTVVAARAPGHRRQVQQAHLFPRHGDVVPAVRPPAAPRFTRAAAASRVRCRWRACSRCHTVPRSWSAPCRCAACRGR
jgi:hypothetical protein